MAGRLHQVLTFVAVPAGGQATLSHDIRWNQRRVIPDWIIPQQGNGAFTIVSCTETQLTIQNDGPDPADFTFWLLSHHSILREFNDVSTQFLSPLPFVLGGGGGGGGTPANFVVWEAGEAWADVAAEIATLSGPVICLVENTDFGSLHEMTAGAVETYRIKFMALGQGAGGAGGSDQVIVRILDGVTFTSDPTGGFARLRSENIFWQPVTTATPIVLDQPLDVYLDGGEVSSHLCSITPFQIGANQFTFLLLGARLTGQGVVRPLVDNAIGVPDGWMVSGPNGPATLENGVFADGSSVSVQHDATSFPVAGFCQTNEDQVDVVLMDVAARVDYDDTLATGANGSLQANEVQTAIDKLKFMTWPEHSSFAWMVGQEASSGFIGQVGFQLPTIVGTLANAGALTNTNPVAATLRRSVTSAAGANSAGEVSTFGITFRPALTGYGGFKLVMRWAPAITIPANMRGFFGINSTVTSLPTTTSPLALLNNIGFAWESLETTLRLQHNDGAGNSTRIDLGVDFPTNSPTTLYTAMIWAHPTVPDSVFWWIKNESNQEVAQGEITTDLPANSVLLAPHMHANNGGTASALRWDFAYMQLIF